MHSVPGKLHVVHVRFVWWDQAKKQKSSTRETKSGREVKRTLSALLSAAVPVAPIGLGLKSKYVSVWFWLPKK